jgi:uncharacterized membrane protein YbhN (UPF0104 family)
MRRLASFLAKATISALLLYLSLRRVNFGSVGERLGALNFGWLVFMLVALCVQTLLLALRWREIVGICGARLHLIVGYRYSLIGLFFSQVLPSTIGGDAARIWLMARGGAGWPMASYSVLIDRVVGVTVLAILVVVCLPWTLDLIHDPVASATLALIGLGTLAGAMGFLALGVPSLRVTERWWLTRQLAVASRLTWQVCRSARAGTQAAALSLAIQMITVIVAWAAAMAAHVLVELSQVLLLIPPVILIATIPVSIAGWGMRESAMVLAFSYAGLADSDGLIISILLGATTFAVGAIGGILWITGGYRWHFGEGHLGPAQHSSASDYS